jgi:3',5'-cyclic-AMP phosphodiesterase
VVKFLRFIVFGDSKDKDHAVNESVLNKLMNQASKLTPEPDFIVVCGDSVAGNEKEEILTAQLQKFRRLIEKYFPNKLLMPVIGNHEVNKDPADDRYERAFSQVYSDLGPHEFLQGYNKTVYCMDFENVKLIILNSFHFGSIHRIDREQLLWLQEITASDKRFKIAFIHSPAFPTGAHLGNCLDRYPEDRDKFWQLVDSCGIDIVFSGHEHNYSRRMIDSSFSSDNKAYTRNVYQIITGGGGEKLKHKFRSKEGVLVPPVDEYHFVVVDIEPEGIKVTAINIKGKTLDEFEMYRTH